MRRRHVVIPGDATTEPALTRTVQVFVAAYVGPSMNPTLRELDLMEIRPCDGRLVRVGDVVCFRRPHSDHLVVHRVVRVSPEGLSTRGDNNSREDIPLLKPSDLEGQVVAVWRGQTRRKIAGGLRGEVTLHLLRFRHLAGEGASRLLHRSYHALSRCGWIAAWVPEPFRPRVVAFRTPGQTRVRLLWGGRTIGQYDDQLGRWEIQRPFRVFVDERVLHRPKDGTP